MGGGGLSPSGLPLGQAPRFLRDGDTLKVMKLDRLARSLTHLGQIVDGPPSQGVSHRILDLGLDNSTAIGKLMLNALGSVAEVVRSMMLERHAKGLPRRRAKDAISGVCSQP